METAKPETTAWTVVRLLDWTRGYLERNGIESPRLCAEILLAHAMQCRRIDLFLRYENVPAEAVLQTFRESVKQAAGGKPIAYLTGTKEFFSLTFEVTPDVLVPRPETEVLVERTIHLLRHGKRANGENNGDGASGAASTPIRSILDLGTGSGCIAVALAKNLPADMAIFAGDISEPALQVARRNAEKHNVAQRIEFQQGDLLAAWPAHQTFDVIVSNPPYLAKTQAHELPANVRDFEPHTALFGGADGLELIRRIIREAPQRLNPDGHLLLEVAFNQSAAVAALLHETAWRDIVTYRDNGGHERVVHARRNNAAQKENA